MIRELDGQGIEIDDIGLRRPTLDDVFMSLTGHHAEQDAGNGDDPEAADPAAAQQSGKDKKPVKEAVK